MFPYGICIPLAYFVQIFLNFKEFIQETLFPALFSGTLSNRGFFQDARQNKVKNFFQILLRDKMNPYANHTEGTGHHSTESFIISPRNPDSRHHTRIFLSISISQLFRCQSQRLEKFPTLVKCFPRYGSETWVKRHKTHLGIGVLV